VFRSRYGGVKADYQILCNSPVPEKPLAAAAGTGSLGRNGLIITRDAGSLVIIAAMTLPFVLPGDSASAPFDLCVDCGNNPPCISACPTGALPGDGTLNRQRCIQWYASGHETTVPDDVSRHWGNRLYGCTDCQDACVHNRRPITGVETTEGMLPDYFDAQELLAMDDGTLQARFKGSVLGGKWLGPAALRRNIREAVQGNG
jgi:epoxyqueuosine reductase